MKVRRVSNVPNLKDHNGNWIIDYFPLPGERHTTRSGLLWGNINIRCKENGAHQKRRPTYVGCVNSFGAFQVFAGWAEGQYGLYTKESRSGEYWALDKDIACIGNMEYNEEYCIFVPKNINVLFPKKKVQANGLPFGVLYVERKFQKSLNYVGKGFEANKLFATKGDAHKYWQEGRIKAIIDHAKSEIIADHTKLLNALDYRISILEDDLKFGRETVRF